MEHADARSFSCFSIARGCSRAERAHALARAKFRDATRAYQTAERCLVTSRRLGAKQFFRQKVTFSTVRLRF